MQYPIQLSKNLKVTSSSIVEIDQEEDTINRLRFYFSFFGETCEAVLSRAKIETDRRSVSYAEGPSEIYESFIEQVEDDHWERLKELFQKEQKEYEAERK
jgi:hypothetical protein